MLLGMTAGVRFDGSLNTDLSELSMNLVPFPSMNFLLASLAPGKLGEPGSKAVGIMPRRLEQVLTHRTLPYKSSLLLMSRVALSRASMRCFSGTTSCCR